MVGETWDNWRENIRKTIELSPDSVTIYQMELPFNTVYSKGVLDAQGETPVAPWPMKREWLRYAFESFQEHGYSISSAYTVIKDPSKVNFSYRDNLWSGADLLATGIASFGHASGVHYQNVPEWDRYLGMILDQGRLPLGRAYRPSPLQLLIREMILQLKRGYLDTSYFQTKFGADIASQWKEVWQDYEKEGYVVMRTDEIGKVVRIELTMEGLLRADGLLPAFFEPSFRGVRYT
jgi:oxygen-independent coproporphyrinogen-3 oxidase